MREMFRTLNRVIVLTTTPSKINKPDDFLDQESMWALGFGEPLLLHMIQPPFAN